MGHRLTISNVRLAAPARGGWLARFPRPLGALLLAAVLLLLAAAYAPSTLAHATLTRSDPAAGSSLTDAPNAVTLWFSESVESAYTTVDLLRSDGSRVLAGDLERLDGAEPALRVPLPDELPRGSYTVVWSTFSAVDGHVSEGFFSFTIGDALLPSTQAEAELARSASTGSPVPLVVDGAIRWMNLLGQAIATGALVFLLVALPSRAPARRYRWLFGLALGVLTLGHLASPLVQTMQATHAGLFDLPADALLTLLTGTRYGALWLARAVLLLALALVLWSLTRGERLPATSGRGRWFWGAALAVAGALLATTSLGSHAAARGGARSWPVLVDWLHLAATSVWVGGLAAFAVALPGLGQQASLRPVLRRFSTVALGAVGVLTMTGVLATRREVMSWDGLIGTRYGMWLTLKLALAAAALGIGAYHLLVIRPALDLDDRVSEPATRGFRRGLRVEALLAIAVVAATGLLTASIPARDLLGQDISVFATTRLTTAASVTLRVTPGRTGTNEFSVVVSPLEPETFGELQRVYLRFARPGMTDDAGITGSERIELRQAGPGDSFTWRATGAWLALDGDWQLTAIIRRSGERDLEAPFAITASRAGIIPTGLPVAETVDDGPPANAGLLGGLWLLVALMLGTGAWWVRRERRVLSAALLALALLALAAGSLVLVVSTVAAGS